MNPYVFPDGRMKASDAALYLGFSEGTLANWRVKGIGPRFIKVGNRVFYFKAENDAWLAAGGLSSSTAQARLTSVN